jgi:hypothetical protein
MQPSSGGCFPSIQFFSTEAAAFVMHTQVWHNSRYNADNKTRKERETSQHKEEENKELHIYGPT